MKVHQGKFEIIADYYIAHYDELLGFVKKQLQYADEAEDIALPIWLHSKENLMLSTKLSRHTQMI